jgi:hypothetical protein
MRVKHSNGTPFRCRQYLISIAGHCIASGISIRELQPEVFFVTVVLVASKTS